MFTIDNNFVSSEGLNIDCLLRFFSCFDLKQVETSAEDVVFDMVQTDMDYLNYDLYRR